MMCQRCAAPGAKAIEVSSPDGVVARGALCDSCLDAVFDGYLQLSEQFEAMLAAGVSREEANRLMIAKINGQGARA